MYEQIIYVFILYTNTHLCMYLRMYILDIVDLLLFFPFFFFLLKFLFIAVLWFLFIICGDFFFLLFIASLHCVHSFSIVQSFSFTRSLSFNSNGSNDINQRMCLKFEQLSKQIVFIHIFHIWYLQFRWITMRLCAQYSTS